MPLQHLQVAVSAIKVPDVRVTAVYDDALREELKGSLDAVGQLQPIVLVKTPDGYDLVDGLHRLEEAQKRGDAKIASVVYEGTRADTMLLNLMTNRLRGQTRSSEMVAVIDYLVHEEGMTSDEIAKRTGMTRNYVERMWKISEGHVAVVAALDSELIGVGVAEQIVRLPNLDQQEMVMAQAGVFHMTTNDVKVLVDMTLDMIANPAEETHHEAPQPPPPPTCEVCRDAPETTKLTQVILCPTCYGKTYALWQQGQGASTPIATDLVNGPSP